MNSINFIFLYFSNFFIVFAYIYSYMNTDLILHSQCSLILIYYWLLCSAEQFSFTSWSLINIVGILEVYLETHLRCYSKSKYFVGNLESISCSKYFGCAVGCYDLQQRSYFPVFTTICYRVQQDVVYLEFYELYCKCLSACWNYFWFLNNWQ